jgi:hypothetical protein
MYFEVEVILLLEFLLHSLSVYATKNSYFFKN